MLLVCSLRTSKNLFQQTYPQIRNVWIHVTDSEYNNSMLGVAISNDPWKRLEVC